MFHDSGFGMGFRSHVFFVYRCIHAVQDVSEQGQVDVEADRKGDSDEAAGRGAELDAATLPARTHTELHDSAGA